MVVLGRRYRGRMMVRMVVCCGWAVSTMTILVIFKTAIDGYKDDVTLPWDAVRPEPLSEIGRVETPNRRSLSADDSESNAAAVDDRPILTNVIGGRPEEQFERHVRGLRRRSEAGSLRFKGGFHHNNESRYFSDGIAPSGIATGKGNMADSTRDDFLSAQRVHRGRRKKSRKRLPTLNPVNKTWKATLEIQTQVVRPEKDLERSRNAGVAAMYLSAVRRESRISMINLGSEEMATAIEINDRPMMGGHLPVTQIQMPNTEADVAETRVSASSADGVPLVEDGIFWSRDVEQLVPEG